MTGHPPATPWRKSARCGANAGCVEIAAVRAHIGIRDSKHGDASPVLVVTRGGFERLLQAIKEGLL